MSLDCVLHQLMDKLVSSMVSFHIEIVFALLISLFYLDLVCSFSNLVVHQLGVLIAIAQIRKD